MTKEYIEQVFNSFSKKKVMIIGDSMIDAYMWGHVDRMSPEAPVHVVDVEKHENRLGGAANVARNIKSLGATPLLCTVVGKDQRGKLFHKLMEEEGLSTNSILVSENRKTTVKTRIIANNKHQLRVDEEDTFDLQEEEAFIKLLEKELTDVDVIILQDYNKGILTRKIIKHTISYAREIGTPTIVDPKKNNFLDYKNCDIFKPNLKEIKEGMGVEFNEKIESNLKEATYKLKKNLNANAILLTLSSDGICINSDEGFFHVPAWGGDVVDVSGAGDTVISVASLLLSEGVSFENISKISCLSGGIVCQKVGVVPVQKEKLLKEAIKLMQ